MKSSASTADDSWHTTRLALVVAALALAAFGAYCWLVRSEPYDTDSQHYQAMAEGRIADVARPFTSRVFSPWLARQASNILGISLHGGFITVGVATSVLLFTSGALL